MLSEVVFCGSETARDERDFGGALRVSERIQNMLRVVADRKDFAYFDAVEVELLRHPRGVGIYDLSDKDFVTYGN